MIYKTLNNNVKIPQLGFGVFQTPVEETKRIVLDAIEIGYRSFDTAQIYGNEAGVGEAVQESGIPREEFFITTKVWISNAGYEKAKASIEESLKKLQTGHCTHKMRHKKTLLLKSGKIETGVFCYGQKSIFSRN